MQDTDTKYIDIKEFKDKGYLQEVNRRFFHPLGLALEIKIDEYSNCFLGRILCSREEELCFDIKNMDKEYRKIFKNKYKYIESELNNRQLNRIMELGFLIEPIEEKEKT